MVQLMVLIHVLLGCSAFAGESCEEGFVRIFDGETGRGWAFYQDQGKPADPRAWIIENGEVVNQAKGCWYRYEAEELENFHLRLEYRLAPKANSGVVLRSLKEGVPWQSGFEVQIIDDHGKDPDIRGSGAIYDVVAPMYNASRPAGEWNEMEIICDGPLIQVGLNGLKVIDTDFSRLTQPVNKFKRYNLAYANLPRKGYLAFQDHGGEVRYRNICVRKLPPGYRMPATAPASDNEEGFEPILDARHTDHWSVHMDNGKQPFEIVDGLIRCRGTWGPYFRYDRPLGDFVLRAQVRTTREGMSTNGNSGIVLRAEKESDPPYSGFEVQILAENDSLPRQQRMGAIYDVVAPMYDAAREPGEWNDFEITCKGLHVVVVLNGWKIIDTDFSLLTTPRGKFRFPYSELPRRGYLFLQDHGDIVEFRNIRVKHLR